MAEGFQDKALGRRLSLGLGLRSFGFGLKVGFRVEEFRVYGSD